MDEIKKVHIEQEVLESLNIKLQNNLSDPISVNVSQGGPISVSLPKVKVELEKEDEYKFLYNPSKELKNNSKVLLTLGILGIMYGKYNITLSQYLGIKVEGDKDILLGILGLFILYQGVIMILYAYRDISKFKIDKIRTKIGFKQDIKLLNDRIKSEGKSEKLNSLLDQKNKILLKNKMVSLQSFHKFFIVFLLNLIIPLYIGYLGFAYTGVYQIPNLLSGFKLLDVLFLLILILLVIVINIFLNKKED